MLRPFLIVGVGGSGGKTLRVIRADLERRLEQSDWKGGFPAAWQLLQIDVPTIADGNDPDLPGQLPASDYQGLVASGVDYRTIDAAMNSSATPHLRDAVGGWRPNPNKVNIPASKGAGQYRALGRIITVAGMDRIKDALRRAHREMTGAQTVAELQSVTRALGGEASTSVPDPTVIVVSSIAGGSGSGAVVDICDVVRSLGDNWAEEIVGLLYAPDVFDYLPEEARRGVRPNSLAALTELLSGYWNDNGPSTGTSELFARYGVQLGAAKRLGPRYPFLVGARNEFVTFKTQNDVYRALGRSMASWIASATLQDHMSAYIQTQWSATASSVRDKLPTHAQGMETPFVALGSARVGLGRDRFRDYAAQNLARSGVERLLNQHEESRAKDDDRPSRALVHDTAETLFGGFLRRSGIDERGEEQNQIIDALQPSTTEERVRAIAGHILQQTSSAIPAKGARPADVSQVIIAALRDQRTAFNSQQGAERNEVAARWINYIQTHLTNEVSRTMAAQGAPVTAELMKRLATEVSQVRDELVAEAAQRRRWAATVEQEVLVDLTDQDTSVILRETGSLKTAISRAAGSLRHEAEAEVRELAVEMIPDLVQNLLNPLIEAIEYGKERLQSDIISGADGRSSVVSTWPQGDIVPSHLKPSPNEFLLEPSDNYPTILSSLIAKTVGNERPVEARVIAERQVLLGVENSDEGKQQLVTLERAWVPRSHKFHDSPSAVPATARFTITAGAEDVLHRARTWLSHGGTPIGSYMAEGLREYLNPDSVSPQEHESRLDRFDGQLVAALNAAAPLVSINPAVLVQVHDRHEIHYSTSFSEIPLPDRSAAKERFTRLLEARGQWSEKVAKAFGDSDGAFVDIFTVLSEPYEPVVFDSLMKPIASEWGQRSTAADTRAEFWRWRRARALPEALPFAPSVLNEMVRGWFVASLLKHLRTEDTVSIYVPAETGKGGEFANFPSPTLTSVRSNGPDILPVLLESFAIAMLDVNTQESLRPMMPYTRLQQLGRAAHTASTAGRDELRAWILNGENAIEKLGDRDGSWEKRKQDTLARLISLEQKYTSHFAEVEDRGEMLDVPLSFELRHQILAALEDLHSAVANTQREDEHDAFQ